jgi:hypothetical protein
MASINYAAREISVKIVYYGPGLSGKTTNLQVIHKKVPKDYRSDMVSLATETDRTLFFDFLPLNLGKIRGFATKFQLYTVPGQVYYNATRKLVLRGVDGIVFVADSSAAKLDENIESFQNLEDNLSEYGYELQKIPTIIQWNKRDLADAMAPEELQRTINKYQLPTTEAIANRGKGVFESLKLIGKVVIDELNRKYSRPTRRTASPPRPGAAPQRGAARPSPAPRPQGPDFGPPPPPQPFQGPTPQQPPARSSNPFVDELSPPSPPPSRPAPADHATPPRQPGGSSGYPADYNTIDLEPTAPTPRQPGFEPPMPPQQNDRGSKSDLDLEIERYQREIQQRPSPQPPSPPPGGNGPGRGPSQYHPPRPPQHTGQEGSQDDEVSFEVSGFPPPPSSPRPQGPPPPPAYGPPNPQGYNQNQGYRVPDAEFNAPQPLAPGPDSGRADGPHDSDRMYFTSVDTDRTKRGKKPINPKNKPKGGLLGRLFNKG